MDYSGSTFWWVAAGVAVAAELATGTFYLLMIALGWRPARCGHLGATLPVQIVAAAVVGGGATARLALAPALARRRSAPVPREPRRQPRHRRARPRRRMGGRPHRARALPRRDLDARLALPGAAPSPAPTSCRAVEGNWLRRLRRDAPL